MRNQCCEAFYAEASLVAAAQGKSKLIDLSLKDKQSLIFQRNLQGWWTAFCIMILRVVVSGKVKLMWSRSESESERAIKSDAADPKLSDLSMAKLKVG